MLERLKSRGFDILALHHAEAIITHDMPEAEREIDEVLLDLSIPILEIVGDGGGQAHGTQRMSRALAESGWLNRNISVKKSVRWEEDADEHIVASLSHEIDHVKAFGPECWVIALEIE